MRYTALPLGLALTLAAFPASAQESARRPVVRMGEILTYSVHSARLGDIGTAVMRVEPDTLRGRAVYRLSFDFNAKITLFHVSDQTRSWLDPENLTTLRYTKSERSPIGRRKEAADVFAPQGIWTGLKGENPLASFEPLDELAFIYFVRGLETMHSELTVERHFDRARNPVRFRCLGYQKIEALGRTVTTHVVQMDVRDTRQKSGQGTLRFYLSDDEARLPLRIASSMPVAGAITLTLASVTLPVRSASQ